MRERESGRAFLFDSEGRFVGHDRGESRITWAKGPVPNVQRLAAAGTDIRAFRSDEWAWHDIGTVEKLAAAEAWASSRPD